SRGLVAMYACNYDYSPGWPGQTLAGKELRRRLNGRGGRRPGSDDGSEAELGEARAGASGEAGGEGGGGAGVDADRAGELGAEAGRGRLGGHARLGRLDHAAIARVCGPVR